MKILSALLFSFFFLFIAGSCAPEKAGQPSTATSAPLPVARVTPTIDTRQLTGELEQGRNVYISQACANCHGGTGEGGTGSTLRGISRTLKEIQEQLRTPTGMMPSYGLDKITDEQIRVLYSYIKSLENIK